MKILLLALTIIFTNPANINSMENQQTEMNAHNFSFESALKDEKINLADHKGKVIIVFYAIKVINCLI